MSENERVVPRFAKRFGDDMQEITSATTTMAQQAIEQIIRREDEAAASSTQEITLDGTNKVAFPGFPYLFTAVNEKIIVSIDVFKTGYECRGCLGKKTIDLRCECEREGRPGKKYTADQIAEFTISLDLSIANARADIPCTLCDGDWESCHKTITCPSCKGQGATLILPDTATQRPTTGVVVSMGKKARELCTEYKVGDRILFGAYAGTMIPTKAGLAFKSMDWTAAMMKIEGANDLAAFDFIIDE